MLGGLFGEVDAEATKDADAEPQPGDAGMDVEDEVRGGGGMQIDEDDDAAAPYATPLLSEYTD